MIRPALLIPALCLAGCSHLTQISHSGAGAYEASVAAGDSGIAVAWYDDRSGNAEIFLSLFDTALKPIREEVRLTDSPAQSYEADVVWLDGDLAVAWYDVTDGRSAVKLGLWDREFNRRWEKTLTGTGNGRVPELVGVGDRLFIAWIDTAERPDGEGSWSDIRGAWLDSAGEFIHGPFFIASASDTTWNLNADGYSDGSVALVYDAAFETAANELYLTLVTATSSVTRRLTADDFSASKYPDIAFHGNKAAISWQDEKDGNQEVYLGVFDFNPLEAGTTQGAPYEVEDLALRVTNTGGESIGAYLAWRDGTLGLAWCDDSSGRHEVFFRRFSATGEPMSSARQLTHTRADSLIPSIEAGAGGFVIAWNEALIDGHGTADNKTTSEVYVSRRR